MRTTKDYIFLTLKGLGMGAADVVPGVSGGTIAFISGIYEELINTLKSIDLNAVKLLFKGKIKDFWKAINGSFLAAVFAGIAISVLSLARVLGYLLENHPVLIWSFFFGLILSSAQPVGRKIQNWNAPVYIATLVGAAIAFYITVATPATTPTALWFVFVSGAIAICAMILPGISGSFILLLLGQYRFILDSISALRADVLAAFLAGCAVGLLSFSRLLSWMFARYHDLTVALLTGFMIGSLNKVWPWKNVLSYRTNSHGEEVPFLEESVLPNSFDGDPQPVVAVALVVVGFALIYYLDRLSTRKSAA
ncbi:MAG: DUF368 domain-containing protein [Flavobacteriales bacterium]|nr:DUF368 domain-containing protein [Flavobacteriales bacterium]